MKKRKVLLVIIFILSVGIATAALVTMIQTGKKPTGPEQVIASGPIVYVECKNIERNLNDFLNSELVKGLKAIDFINVARQVGVPEKEIALYQGIAEQLQSENNRRIFFTLFGEQTAIAAYRIKQADGEKAMLMDRAASVVVVTRLKPGAQLIEALTGMLAKFNPEIKERITEYKGKEIHLIGLQGGLIELGYIKLGDFLVMGLGEKTVRVTVDVWAGEREGLSQDPLWKQLQERALLGSDKTGFFRYADFMAGVREAMQQFPAKGRPLDAATQARIDESFRYAEAFNAFFFSVTYGKVWHGLMEVSFDLQKMPDEIKKVYNQPAGANRSTAFIPSDVIMYSWTTMMGLPFYLETWQREEKRNQPPEADAQNPVAGEAEAVPGMPTPVQGALAAMDTSGLSKMFTDELGWFFSGFKISQIAPVPNLVIFLGVQDPAKVETFLAEKLRSTLPVPLQTENYNGVTISYLGGIPFLTGIEPAYCMIDGFFLVSTQRELLKKSIDLKAAGSGGIEANPVVGQAGYGLLDQGNGMMFIQCDGLMNSLLELVHWANRWADVQFERRQAFKKGSEQRLVDVKAEMEKKQQELDPLEQQLVTLQEQKAALEATPTDDVTVSEEVTRRQKIIAAAEKSLAALEKERVDLEKIKNTPGQQLPPEGEKRLTDLNLEIEEKDSRIKTLRRELAPFEAAQKKELDRAQQIAALGTQIQELENLFGQGRQALKASEATVQELETTIKGYETDPSPKPGQRKIMIDELIDPLIKALMNIKWVSIKTRVDPGWMTSDVYGEIK